MPLQVRRAIISAVIAFTGSNGWASESPRTLSAAQVMQLPAPPALRFKARDGAALAYRLFTPQPSAEPS